MSKLVASHYDSTLTSLFLDLFVAIVTSASNVGSIRPGEPVMRIGSVSFYCLNRALWDDAVSLEDLSIRSQSSEAPKAAIAQPHDIDQPINPQPNIYEDPCASLKKLLSTGTFYFAQEGRFDLSRRLEKRVKFKPSIRRKPPPPPVPNAAAVTDPLSTPSMNSEEKTTASESDQMNLWNYDARFVWNSYMMDPLLEYRNRLESEDRDALDAENFFILAIQGFVGVEETLLSSSSIALVSRLSWKRAGTRYNTRGIDDDGNVANFAESETIFCWEDNSMSYCQVRGSVPLFWEQQGLQTFNAKIQVTRPLVASQPAFDRHFNDLLQHYDAVHSVNLLGTRDAETVLSSAYAEHMRHSDAEQLYLSSQSKMDSENAYEDGTDRIGLTNFDFHTTSRLTGGLDGVKSELLRLTAVQSKQAAFQYTLCDKNGMTSAQKGVFRTNCLDCLDRTNVVEDILSQSALDQLVRSRDDLALFRDVNNPLWTSHRMLWAENGDSLSKIYAGTGALNTTYTRTGSGKKTLGGLLSDAAKSASRMYINNFQDKSKQNVIDALLGNMANQKPVSVWDPLHDSVNLELLDRMDEYSTKRSVAVFAGTWNLAGRIPTGEDLEPWLFPNGSASADVYALGLQEVVPLTAQQILMTDPDKLRAWEAVVSKAFTVRHKSGEKDRYVLLRSEQLVGTALLILLKESLVSQIRQVEASTKKTGLKGMSGNKGGVAIRMNIFDTSFCFVTAHFAAGKANVEERNADFITISRELHFNSGRNVNNSNYCFWFGDFNYRLEGGNEMIRPMCEADNFDGLKKADQLIRAKASRQVFAGYKEGEIQFKPTYKYDFMSQKYDSSEKMRVPAWTDRILYKSQHPFEVNLIQYNRAELLTSDHRPVFAQFVVEARVFDSTKRNSLRRELLAKHKAEHTYRNGITTSAQDSSEDLMDDSSGRDDDDDDDDDMDDFGSGYKVEDLPLPSTSASNWWDDDTSLEEGKNDSDEDSDWETSAGNPFLRNRPQYATRPNNATDSPAMLSSAASSYQDRSALPSSRRAAPIPPSREKASTAPNTPQPPPPIPRKPVLVKSNGDSTSPALPARPSLGPRAKSHTSIKSLLDGSDEEEVAAAAADIKS